MEEGPEGGVVGTRRSSKELTWKSLKDWENSGLCVLMATKVFGLKYLEIESIEGGHKSKACKSSFEGCHIGGKDSKRGKRQQIIVVYSHRFINALVFFSLIL